ncbi:hypoxia-inducible factor 1-alpha-like isoform X2 [Gigantopelta aegis]|uniref:hypoxia-inducible factor 1-alpha-like isoform X2 n=1 Tax=Gigantopelta aegis TaxID=1735272 RepID=UPI001B889A49|nr:hypoxia-inducible factor 1-alpha-like isoform X2 [Gigantopelta aegis]
MPYKNSDKRKEKSRDAARCRRSKESEVFYDLAHNLPLPVSVCSQLDKASIMRLSISYLKLNQILDKDGYREDEDDFDLECEEDLLAKRLEQLYPKALEGFIFILSKDADIIYLSENVVKYLGIPQIELIGQSLYDFSHPCDHEEIRDMLSVRASSQKSKGSEDKVFFIRLKCTLTSKGRNVNLKSATYKVLKCTGHLVTEKKGGKDTDGLDLWPYLLSVGEPIPHPSNIEAPLDSHTFLSKHNMDMTFTYCDERIEDLIGYNCEDLIDKSLYNYHHALDNEIVEKAYKDLFAKGQIMTGQYRFLAKGGGYVWVITQGTIIYNNRTQKPQWVVCVHYIMSAVEERDTILSEVQLPSAKELLPFNVELVTDKIFVPKTKDMDEGFYLPQDLKSPVTLEEPEDLDYLAPNAGEGCVPLGFPTLEQVLMYGQGCKKKLLSPTTLKEEPGTSMHTVCRQKEMISSTATTPEPQSPQMKSPEEYTTPANMIDVNNMDQFFSVIDPSAKDEAEAAKNIDMSMRAPFIPMTAEEDLCLMPPSETLYSMNTDFDPGLFGKTETVFMPKSALFEFPPAAPQPSVHEMIEGSTVVQSIERPADKKYQQVKRPLDMNSLEKGPPVSKVMKMNLPPASQDLNSGGMASKDSVLLNLLLTGEDRNHGYKVSSLLQGGKQQLMSTSQSMLLPCLTNHDCEVNAPTSSHSNLLQGQDLIQALEQSHPRRTSISGKV